MTTEIEQTKNAIATNGRGAHLQTLEEMFRFATMLKNSGMSPKSMATSEQILVAMQTGMEAGLTPMKAVQSVVVINGLPSWKGDAALALVRGSGLMSKFSRKYEGTGDDYCCVLSSSRDGDDVFITRFTVADAKKARLWGRQGPWSEYTDRMLYYRTLGFHLRDLYPDVLMGIPLAEEVADYPPSAVKHVENTVNTEPVVDPLLTKGSGVVEDSHPVVEDVSPPQTVAPPGTKPNTTMQASVAGPGETSKAKCMRLLGEWTGVEDADLGGVLSTVRGSCGINKAAKMNAGTYTLISAYVEDQISQGADFFAPADPNASDLWPEQ